MFDPREQDFCQKIIVSPVEVNATMGGRSFPVCYTLPWTDATGGDSTLPVLYNLLWTPVPATIAPCQCAKTFCGLQLQLRQHLASVLQPSVDSSSSYDSTLPVCYNLLWTSASATIAPCQQPSVDSSSSYDSTLPVCYNLMWTPAPAMTAPCPSYTTFCGLMLLMVISVCQFSTTSVDSCCSCDGILASDHKALGDGRYKFCPSFHILSLNSLVFSDSC